MTGLELFGALMISLMVALVYGTIAQDVYDMWVGLSEEEREEENENTFLLNMEKRPEVGDLCWDDSAGYTCIYFGECLGEDNNIYSCIGYFTRHEIIIAHTLPSALHVCKQM